MTNIEIAIVTGTGKIWPKIYTGTENERGSEPGEEIA